jgi:hypothetical protein
VRIPWLVPWVLAPAIAGAYLAAVVDLRSLPLVGTESIEAVFFTDGQAYFGQLDDNALTGTLTLRDVYYLGDAKGRGTDFDASVVKRGTEVHQPADGMRIRRDKVLAIERVGLGSPVARAIAAQRALDRASGR